MNQHWGISVRIDGDQHASKPNFADRKSAEKAASKLQALADEAGFTTIFYAVPAEKSEPVEAA